MQSKKIIDVFGIPIFLHWSILPMLALLLGINVFSTAPLLPLITYPSLLLIVTLHELGHCYAAKKLGIGVEKITLTGIGGIAQISTMSDTKREAVITLAGPLVNVIMGL